MSGVGFASGSLGAAIAASLVDHVRQAGPLTGAANLVYDRVAQNEPIAAPHAEPQRQEAIYKPLSQFRRVGGGSLSRPPQSLGDQQRTVAESNNAIERATRYSLRDGELRPLSADEESALADEDFTEEEKEEAPFQDSSVRTGTERSSVVFDDEDVIMFNALGDDVAPLIAGEYEIPSEYQQRAEEIADQIAPGSTGSYRAFIIKTILASVFVYEMPWGAISTVYKGGALINDLYNATMENQLAEAPDSDDIGIILSRPVPPQCKRHIITKHGRTSTIVICHDDNGVRKYDNR